MQLKHDGISTYEDMICWANLKYITNWILSQWAARCKNKFPTTHLLHLSLSSAVLECDNEHSLQSHQLTDSHTYPHTSLTWLCEFDNWEFAAF